MDQKEQALRDELAELDAKLAGTVGRAGALPAPDSTARLPKGTVISAHITR